MTHIEIVEMVDNMLDSIHVGEHSFKTGKEIEDYIEAMGDNNYFILNDLSFDNDTEKVYYEFMLYTSDEGILYERWEHSY